MQVARPMDVFQLCSGKRPGSGLQGLVPVRLRVCMCLYVIQVYREAKTLSGCVYKYTHGWVVRSTLVSNVNKPSASGAEGYGD